VMLQCCSMTTNTSLSLVLECSKVILWALYFCCGIVAMVNDIQATNPVYNKWYMDDGGIIGDVELLKKVWDLLQTRGLVYISILRNASGLGCNEPCPIRL